MEKNRMETRKLILSAVAAGACVFGMSASAGVYDLGVDSFSLLDGAGGTGDTATNVNFFSAAALPYATGMYVRERSDALNERKVDMNVNFDVSGIAAAEDVLTATLTFDAYQLSAIGVTNTGFDLEIGQLTAAFTYAGATINGVAQTPAIDVITSPSLVYPVTSYIFDVTAIVQDWVDGGAGNFGFLFDMSATVNNGMGFADSIGDTHQDGTTATNMMNLNITTTPEPGSLALLGLGGLAMIRRRR
jgi:hypothetical protein